MSTPDTTAWVPWVAGAGALAFLGVVALMTREGGGVDALHLYPTWMTSWVRERPEFYAELVSRIASGSAKSEARRYTRELYEAMEEVRGSYGSFYYMPMVPMGAHEDTAYDFIYSIIKNGKPREVLTDEERGLLREFMEAAAAYKRLHQAAVEEAESGADIGDLYTGALVTPVDLAHILVKDVDAVRERLEVGLRKHLSEMANAVQQSKRTGRYVQYTTAELEDKLSAVSRALQMLRMRDKVPFVFFKMHMRAT